jgi:hypothetical protein
VGFAPPILKLSPDDRVVLAGGFFEASLVQPIGGDDLSGRHSRFLRLVSGLALAMPLVFGFNRPC